MLALCEQTCLWEDVCEYVPECVHVCERSQANVFMCFVLLTVAGDKEKKRDRRLKEEEEQRLEIKEKLENRGESFVLRGWGEERLY